MDNVDPQGGSDRYSQRSRTDTEDRQRSRTDTEYRQRSRTDTEDRQRGRTITIIFPGPEGLKPSMKQPARTRPKLNRSLIRI